jgi:threonine synthase
MGNVTAGLLAQRMGVPIDRFCCGVNANNILDRAVRFGEFRKKEMVRTLSEAINIGVPYNFERILYFLTMDCDKTAEMMSAVDATSELTIAGPLLADLRDLITTKTVDDEEMKATTLAHWEQYSYVIDPHTAVCIAAAAGTGMPNPGTVCLATAHPCKFEEALLEVGLGDDFWQGSTTGLAGTIHMPESARALQGMAEAAKDDFVAVEGGSLEESQAAWEQQLRGQYTHNPPLLVIPRMVF